MDPGIEAAEFQRILQGKKFENSTQLYVFLRLTAKRKFKNESKPPRGIHIVFINQQ